MSKPTKIKNSAFSDERGFFRKLFDSGKIPDFHVRQTNYVDNPLEGTLRGLHFQMESFNESKIFMVLKGSIQLAFMSINRDSWGESDSCILESPEQALHIPRGYATGYLVLEPATTVLYFSDNIYNPEFESGIRWDDPIHSIKWIIQPKHISKKDQRWDDAPLSI